MSDRVEKFTLRNQSHAFLFHGWYYVPRDSRDSRERVKCRGCGFELRLEGDEDIADINCKHSESLIRRNAHCRYSDHYCQESTEDSAARHDINPLHLASSSSEERRRRRQSDGYASRREEQMHPGINHRNHDPLESDHVPPHDPAPMPRGIDTSATGNSDLVYLRAESSGAVGGLQSSSLRSGFQCKLCLENNRELVTVPCRHVVSCKSCLDKLLPDRRCPCCRTTYRETIKINFQSTNSGYSRLCSMCERNEANIIAMPCNTLMWCSNCYSKHRPTRCSDCESTVTQHVKVYMS